MANSDIGTLSSIPTSQDRFTVTLTDSTDVFEFNVLGSTVNINLNLNNMGDLLNPSSTRADADLRLFRDNGNGVFDSGDALVASSVRGSNFDDSINVRTTGGTYFAQVNRLSPTTIVYDLDLSSAKTSNLLPFPSEIQVNTLTGDRTVGGNVGDLDTSDTYSFTLPAFAGVNIELSGLSSDADLRLIRDSNNNRIVDANEVVASSGRSGIQTDIISNINQDGNYIVQVYQFNGNTNYQLRLDHFSTAFA